MSPEDPDVQEGLRTQAVKSDWGLFSLSVGQVWHLCGPEHSGL